MALPGTQRQREAIEALKEISESLRDIKIELVS
jgi:hypothetical protein